jgi:hypothetical protein
VTRTWAQGAAALAALVLLAGCEGEDDSSKRAPAPAPKQGPSKREFIARADRLCAEVSRRGRDITTPEPKTPEELVRAAREMTALYRSSVRRLERIGLPRNADARAGAERFLDSVRRLADPVGRLEQSAERLQRAVATRSRDRLETAVLELQEALIDLRQEDRRSTKVAKRYGMEDCAEDASEDRPPQSPEDSEDAA